MFRFENHKYAVPLWDISIIPSNILQSLGGGIMQLVMQKTSHCNQHKMGEIQPFTCKTTTKKTQVFVGLQVSNSNFLKFYFRNIICTGAAVLQCWYWQKKYWSVRREKSSFVDGMQYKCLWDYKSVSVVFQGFISEV